MALAEVFKALGDPVRLELVERLSSGHRQSISVVTANLGLTRQGARRHLQVLADVQIVRLTPSGRDVWVELDPVRLEQAKAFIAKLEMQWEDRLAAFKDSVERNQSKGDSETEFARPALPGER